MYTYSYRTIQRRSNYAYATLAIIIVNIIVYLFENISISNYNFLVLNYGLIPADIVSGQNLYTIFTSMFLHASLYEPLGIIHIFFNMYILFLFGNQVEKTMKPAVFIIFYFFSGLIAGLFHSYIVYFIDPVIGAYIPTIGASGAVFGVLAGFAVLFPKRQLFTFFGAMPAWILIIGFVAIEVILSILPVSGFASIANTAHIGGFIGGLIFTLLYRIISKRMPFKKKKEDQIPIVYL